RTGSWVHPIVLTAVSRSRVPASRRSRPAPYLPYPANPGAATAPAAPPPTHSGARLPKTTRERVRRSAPSLRESGRLDLNQRPFGPQPNALPDCATPRGFGCERVPLGRCPVDTHHAVFGPRRVKRATGLEPATFSL